MEAQNVSNNQKCFVSMLSRLRESSKEAVVSSDADFNDPYTMYMHVDRPVQDRFLSILNETYNSEQSELILLCGSVGDGKSHMLSYCKSMYPDKMDKFYVHNDSTASLYVDKPASYTLKQVLEDFSDDRIEKSNGKVILAINLGTLSNFLEADENNKFGKLKSYVENSGILNEKIDDKGENHFHCVNFADYHLYELTSKGVVSSYIQGILNKITDKNEINPFYNDFCQTCEKCQSKDLCPIKVNYELISDKKIQNGIISTLVETIVKNKLIVSTRTLLNMIYEVLVDERNWTCGSLEPRKEPERLTSLSYCKSLLPNVLFEKRESSEVLDAVESIDPMQIRNENIDDFFVFYINSNNVLQLFKNNLPDYSRQIERLSYIDFSDRSTYALKVEILKLFVRTCWLTGIRRDLLPEDKTYEEYMKALYAWNIGNYMELKNIYNVVEKGILAWNGQVTDQNEMQVLIKNKKSKYHLIQKIQIRKKVDDLPKQEPGILSMFRDEMRLKYRYSRNLETELDVDYSLYKLLKMVINGYIPNMNDKRVNVKCVEFINIISQGGSKREELYIRDLSQKVPKEYKLTFDDIFGYSFEVN